MDKKVGLPVELLEIKNRNLKTKLGAKQKEIDELLIRIEELIAENKALKKQLIKPVKEKDNYDNSRTWISKIVYIVGKENKPLRSADIIELLLPREPALNQKVSKEKFISPFLNSAMQYERLVPFKLKGVRGNYYCLPDWVDEQGKLLPDMRKKIY